MSEPTKFHNGCFVFFRSNSSYVPMLPSEIEKRATLAGIAKEFHASYSGDRAIVGRAISSAQSIASKQHCLLRPIIQTKTNVVYGVVRESKDEVHEHLDHEQEGTIEWSCEQQNGVGVGGSHPLAHDVDAIYQGLRGKVLASDWTASIVKYLVEQCHGVAMREGGVIYWVPPQVIWKLQAMTAFLGDIGIALILCEIESAATTIVKQAAMEGLSAQLEALKGDIEQFDAKTQPRNYKARIEDITRLRTKATMFREALSIGVEEAQKLLDTLQVKTQVMLQIREAGASANIPPSGAEDGTVIPASAPTTPQFQTFADSLTSQILAGASISW